MSSSVRTIISWLLRIVVALALIAAGTLKLTGNQSAVAMFETIGIGQWFRILTGALEVAGALMLLIPRTVLYGAILLSCVMAGAIVSHLFVIGGSPLAALVLLMLTLTIIWLNR